jgi:biopolymer transport protein ExbD
MKADLEGDDSGIVAEINMIPLIDVSLVLLIIFMVMTPVLVRSQINVNLPTATGSASSDHTARVDVEVRKDGAVYVEGQPASAEQLGKDMAGRVKVEPDVTVVISADRAVVFDHVVKVMDAVKQAGVTKLGVSVSPVRRDVPAR